MELEDGPTIMTGAQRLNKNTVIHFERGEEWRMSISGCRVRRSLTRALHSFVSWLVTLSACHWFGTFTSKMSILSTIPAACQNQHRL